MGQRVVLAIIALAAVAAAVWLLAGSDLLPSGDGGGRGGAGGSGGATLAAPGEGTEGAAGSEKSGPRLFGRSRADRAGKGGVVARVMDFRTGQPVAGAKALLAGTGFADEAVSLRGISAADGSLRFGEVAAGDAFVLRIEAEGHPARSLPSVGVTAGQVADLGTIWFGRRATLEGVVLDPDGKGVADAAVAVHPVMPGLMDLMQDMMGLISKLDQDPEPLARARTDRTGRFRIEDLDPGQISLLVRAPGYALKAERATMTSDGAAGGEVTILLARGQTAGGRVVDVDGKGIAGARLAVMAENDPEAWVFGRTFAESGPDGAFRFDTLPPGNQFTVVASARGYPMTFGRVAGGAEDAKIVLHALVPVTVRVLAKGTDEPVEGATVAIAIGGKKDLTDQPESLLFGKTDRAGRAEIDGRLGHLQMAFVTHPEFAMGMWMGSRLGAGVPGMMDGPEKPEVTAPGAELTFRMPIPLVLQGRVTGPDGSPVVGARVSSMGMPMAGAGVLSDEDGRYRLVVPRIGRAMAGAVILARAPGYVQSPASFMVGGEPEPDGTVTHDILLQRAAVVTGRVVAKDGGPVPGALVAFRGGTGDQQAMGMAAMFGSVQGVTAEDGSYVLDGAQAGKDAQVFVRVPGYVETSSAKFEVAAGASVRAPEVVLRRGASLLVRVTGSSGEPLAGARVEVSLNRGADVAFDVMEMMRGDADILTDERGIARLRHLKSGTGTVTAAARGHAAARETVEIPEQDGAEREVILRLAATVPVTGRVTDGAGKPVADARVTGGPPSAPDSAIARTDGEGRFVLDGLGEGPLTLRVRAPGYTRQKIDVDRRREDLEVRLLPEDPDKARRRQEVSTELSRVMTDLQAAKDEAERKILQQRLQDLSQELAELGIEGDGVVELSEPEVAPAEPAPSR